MNIVKSALGRYEPAGNVTDADCIIGHSFGTLTGEGSANRALAHFITAIAAGRPVIADTNLAIAFPEGRDAVEHVVEGSISNLVASKGGSWGTLVEAKQLMTQEGLSRPLMIAQAFHIGRVVMQAEKLGIESIVPANLPRDFDEDSDQIWTKSLALWLPREILGSFVLRAEKKL